MQKSKPFICGLLGVVTVYAACEPRIGSDHLYVAKVRAKIWHLHVHRVAGQSLLAAAHGSTVTLSRAAADSAGGAAPAAGSAAAAPVCQLALPSNAAGTVVGLWQLPAPSAIAETAAHASLGAGQALPGGSGSGSVLLAGRVERKGAADSLAVWQLPDQVSAQRTSAARLLQS